MSRGTGRAIKERPQGKIRSKYFVTSVQHVLALARRSSGGAAEVAAKVVLDRRTGVGSGSSDVSRVKGKRKVDARSWNSSQRPVYGAGRLEVLAV